VSGPRQADGRGTARDLEDELLELAPSVAYPPTPDLARAVRERIEREGIRPRRWLELGGSFPVRRSSLLALAALLALAGAVVAGSLGVGPLRVLFVSQLPSPAPTGTPGVLPGAGLSLGVPTSFEQVQDGLPFGLGLPAREGLGRPDAVYLDERPAAPVVNLVWGVTPDLPAAGPGSDVGLLLTETRGLLTDELVKKLLAGETRVQEVRVGGARALWITGAPHTLLYLDANGDVVDETVRLVGDALVWERGGILYRLESGLGLEETMRIAESIP
jgi:hypothetical protein